MLHEESLAESFRKNVGGVLLRANVLKLDAGTTDLQLEGEFRVRAFWGEVDEEESKAEGEGSCWTLESGQ